MLTTFLVVSCTTGGETTPQTDENEVKVIQINQLIDKLPDEIMCLGLEPEDVAKTVVYVMNLPHEITIPSIEVRHIKNY